VVGPSIGVLDGGQHAAKGKGRFGRFWEFSPICFNGALSIVRLVCEKLTMFPYGQDIRNIFSLAFDDIVTFKIEVGIYEKYAKCNSHYMQKILPHCMLQRDDVLAMTRVAN